MPLPLAPAQPIDVSFDSSRSPEKGIGRMGAAGAGFVVAICVGTWLTTTSSVVSGHGEAIASDASALAPTVYSSLHHDLTQGRRLELEALHAGQTSAS